MTMLVLIGTKSYPPLPHIDVASALAQNVPAGRYALRVWDGLGKTVYFVVRSRRKLKNGLVRLYADNVCYA
jgi:hypothetical protein